MFDGLFADPLDSTGTTSASGVAPRIIASYDVTDATQVNAQVSKGFRLGGINDPLNAPICFEADLATFGGRGTWEDEELWNYEAGVKSTFLGGRGTFSASGPSPWPTPRLPSCSRASAASTSSCRGGSDATEQRVDPAWLACAGAADRAAPPPAAVGGLQRGRRLNAARG